MPVKWIWNSDAAQASAALLLVAAVLGIPASGTAFAGDRNADVANLPVRQRTHPEMDPAGLNYEGVRFFPSLLVGMAFDSNIYASSRNPADDIALVLAPELSIRSDGEFAQTTFDLGAMNYHYQEFDSENRTEAHARLKSARQFSNDITLETLLAAAHRFEERGSSLTLPNALKPIAYNDLSAQTTVVKTFSRLGVAVTGGVRSLSFENGESFTGETIDQSFRDGTILMASVKPFYDISPGYRAYTLLTVNRRDYEGTGIFNRDSQGYDVRAGMDYALTSMLFGSVDLGYLQQDYRDPLIPDASGLSTKLNLTWLMTPLMTVSLFGSRQVSELAAQEQEARIDLTIGGRVDYELRRNLIASIDGTYTHEDFTGSPREDETYQIGTKIDYMMNPYCNLGLRYSYFQRNSTEADFSFDRHLVMLNVTAQY